MDCSLPVYSVHGIFQAWILEWVGISSSRESSWPRDWTCVSCVAGKFFTIEPPGKPAEGMVGVINVCWKEYVAIPTSSTSLWWASIQHDWYLYKNGKFGHKERHAQREDYVKRQKEHCVKAEDWDGAQQLRNAKDCQQPPDARREVWNRCSSTVLSSSFQNCEIVNLYWSKQPSLRYFVMAGLET